MLASSSRTALRRVSSRVHGPPTRVIPDTTHIGCHARSMAFEAPRSKEERAGRVAKNRAHQVENRLRGQPFRNAPDTNFRGELHGTSLGRFNLTLSNASRDGQTQVTTVLRVAAQMREEGVQPDITTFHHILRSLADHGLYAEAVACVDEMDRLGIMADPQAFYYILQAANYADMDAFWKVLDMMAARNLRPNEMTYEALIKRHCAATNLEHALQSMLDLQSKGMSITLGATQALIDLACRLGNSRLALDLAEMFNASTFRRLESTDWHKVLIACAEDLYADGVKRSWHEIVSKMNIVPDEGTCMLVLNTAARHGLYKLADEVLRTLQSLQVPWREEHFSPLIEACARANRLKDGFAALALMRTAGVEPEPTTATPLLDAIGQDTDALDAAWGLLDEMREHGRTIDPAALDVVIQASIALGDLQRALGVYKSAGALDVLPSVRTFNTLLAGCVAAQHRPLGDQLLAEMRAAGVTADAGTYEALISLCLTQENYEDAFFYLEEMKAQGHLPPAAVYEAIVRTCASRQDTRYQIALDEMRQCRYDISLSLKNYIRDSTSGRPDDSPQEAPSITDRAQMFQESVHADAGAGAGGR